MAARVALTALLLTSLMLAGCSGGGGGDGGADGGNGGGGGSGGSGGGNAPALSVGDEWLHRSDSGGIIATVTTRVAALEDHEGTPSYRMTSVVDSSANGATTHSEGTTWLRRSDMAALSAEQTTTTSVTGYSYDIHTVTTYEAPCLSLEYPLEVGSSWTVSCTMTVDADGQQSTTTTSSSYEVTDRASVTVPAGTFDAFVVTQTNSGQPTTLWVVAGCAGTVKTQTVTSSQTITSELQSYDC